MNYQRNSNIIKIAGGGVAGLSAAISLKKFGFNPIIFEKNHVVGGNRHGDYEGLENCFKRISRWLLFGLFKIKNKIHGFINNYLLL